MAESAIRTGRIRGVLVGRGVEDRVCDILEVKERLIVGVRVGVREGEGGMPIVPAKL